MQTSLLLNEGLSSILYGSKNGFLLQATSAALILHQKIS